MTTMMQCGHAANATNKAGKPVCAICVGIDPGAEIAAPAPDLAGRVAWCTYHSHCHHKRPSSTDLPFFEHCPEGAHDWYYCGCYGWD